MIPWMARRTAAVLVSGIGLISLYAAPVLAQRPTDLPSMDARSNVPINAAKDISWTQKLDNPVPLETTFRDESGKVVPLSAYFGKRPVLLVMPFYKCPGICTQELNGMVDAFRDEHMKYRVGRDFDVVTISIDPTEGAELATAKKREYLDILNQPGAENGWHFLTGDEKSIRAVADQVGYKYAFNPANRSYAHPGGMVVLTPGGLVSRYFFGVGFPARDVKLALTEAGQGHIGTVTDQFLLACYHYDPATGTYGPKIFLLMQILGFSTIALLGGFIYLSLRRDVHDPKYVLTTSGDAVPQRKA